MLKNEPQASTHRFALDDRARWQHAARKNMTLDEVRRLPVIGKPVFIDGDGLKHRDATSSEAGTKFSEIGGPIVFTHRLDHLDRDDAVEAPVNIAIIEKPQIGAAVRSVASKPRFGIGKLLGREGY